MAGEKEHSTGELPDDEKTAKAAHELLLKRRARELVARGTELYPQAEKGNMAAQLYEIGAQYFVSFDPMVLNEEDRKFVFNLLRRGLGLAAANPDNTLFYWQERSIKGETFEKAARLLIKALDKGALGRYEVGKKESSDNDDLAPRRWKVFDRLIIETQRTVVDEVQVPDPFRELVVLSKMNPIYAERNQTQKKQINDLIVSRARELAVERGATFAIFFCIFAGIPEEEIVTKVFAGMKGKFVPKLARDNKPWDRRDAVTIGKAIDLLKYGRLVPKIPKTSLAQAKEVLYAGGLAGDTSIEEMPYSTMRLMGKAIGVMASLEETVSRSEVDLRGDADLQKQIEDQVEEKGLKGLFTTRPVLVRLEYENYLTSYVI